MSIKKPLINKYYRTEENNSWNIFNLREKYQTSKMNIKWKQKEMISKIGTW